MKTWLNRNDSLQAVAEKLSQVTVSTETTDTSITDWLGNLNLFYGVPFHNLVPNPDMLPTESIRFFYVDANWMEALMDGALSIGRMTSTDISTDLANKSALKQAAIQSAANHRARLTSSDPISEPTPPVAGFFLRSKLVVGWPGLEVQVYETSGDDTPLKALRLERISSDVMLALYNSTFEEVVLAQPPEALHFGADDNNGTYTRDLRSLGIGTIPMGYDLSEESYNEPVKSVTNFMRSNAPRVVDVTTLAGQLTDGLKKDNQLGSFFTSAEFAVQMLETAHRAIITISS